ncbi:hypothetical protein GGS26DRAFT_533333 [Hypomontagnella submonticulosa]|nr:hypothetical protein GGS26DRAFT_533333 [Hypomontagnella submonticulosa]
MPLRHIAIPSRPLTTPPRYPTYALATGLQSKLQQDLLAWKASPSGQRPAPPSPALITFTPAPTYTLGRRQTEPLSADELARLRAPLHMSSSSSRSTYAFAPAILHAPRGGLTTYHGPGQIVLWPVIDLRSPLHAHFSVRDYTCLLEKTTIATLRKLFGITGFTTANPGVWVRPPPTLTTESESESEDEKKISALGVHLRRHVTGLGVAINLSMPVVGPETTNPWARIVACGLGDRGVTSVAAHLGSGATPSGEEVAAAWAAEFADRLGVGGNGEDGFAVEEDSWERWEREARADGSGEGEDYVEA